MTKSCWCLQGAETLPVPVALTLQRKLPPPEMLCQGSAPAEGTQMYNQPSSSSAGPSLWIPGAIILLCAFGVLTMAAVAVSARWRRM